MRRIYTSRVYVHSASIALQEPICGGESCSLPRALFLVARPPDPGTLSLVCVSWCEYNNSLMNECVQMRHRTRQHHQHSRHHALHAHG